MITDLNQQYYNLIYVGTTQKIYQAKPVEVCREVGFENLSHFSVAFQKQFDYAPKEIL
ncbi:AraC family transcriptional regulator [Pedobacter psychrodurus]|uniref:AraC family transcriptional regulator n=1 Tax=Pedobacter psychrodurus TaxID=2530456 RepID=UPI00197EFDC6|nr:AraC family transcriptional regulator [Pedobacter psychrodurus]